MIHKLYFQSFEVTAALFLWDAKNGVFKDIIPPSSPQMGVSSKTRKQEAKYCEIRECHGGRHDGSRVLLHLRRKLLQEFVVLSLEWANYTPMLLHMHIDIWYHIIHPYINLMYIQAVNYISVLLPKNVSRRVTSRSSRMGTFTMHCVPSPRTITNGDVMSVQPHSHRTSAP